ncbi:MAG: CHAD domain-containing protein [Dehalococcoidia bacterium]|nr:CHAD domain-containing protein [Dehalococcoidia bacterium]
MEQAVTAPGAVKIVPFAAERARELMQKLGKEIENSRTHGDPDAIHDLRVAVRRLSQCLDVFSGLFPSKSAKRVRKRIRRIRQLAGDVRDIDIALELLGKVPLPVPDGFPERLAQQREHSYAALTRKLNRLEKRQRLAEWYQLLGLEPQS